MSSEYAKTNLASFQNAGFDRGAPRWKEALWWLLSAVFFRHSLSLGSGLKVQLLRLFGAEVGTGVLIKPNVNIKFPWKLCIGDAVWIGEHVWIDNLAPVYIANDVCLSQGAMLLTGNHDYKKPGFDLVTKPIFLEAGVWVGAKAVVCPGVRLKSHSVLTVGSVAVRDLEAYEIYQGNPAIFVRRRMIQG